MTIRWIESFDIFRVLYAQAQLKYFDVTSSLVSWSTYFKAGRVFGSGFAINPTVNTLFEGVAFPDSRRVSMGAAFKITTPAESPLFTILQSSRLEQCSLWIMSDGRLTAKRGGVILGISDPIPEDEWVYIEFWADVHPDSGFVQVRLNETIVIFKTVINTALQGIQETEAVDLRIDGAAHGSIWCDDFYVVADESANPLGDIVVETLLPEEDVLTQWTEFGPGIDHWAQVDDFDASDEDISYISSGTAGNYDLFQHGLPTRLRGNIEVVMEEQFLRRTAAGIDFLNNAIQIGTTIYNGGAFGSTSTVYDHGYTLWALNPETNLVFLARQFKDIAFGARFTS